MNMAVKHTPTNCRRQRSCRMLCTCKRIPLLKVAHGYRDPQNLYVC